MVDTGTTGVSRPVDRIGRAHIAKPTYEDVGGRISSALMAFVRLFSCVLLLVTIGAAALIYGSTPVPGGLTNSYPWLGLGFLLLPLTFFAIHLVNRRYGPGYAMAQVFIGWLFAFIALPLVREHLGDLLPGPLPALRDVAGFACALFLAHMLSILIFDRMRGPRWWTAPFVSSLFAGLAFCVVAFPAAYAGTGIDWTGRMIVYMGVIAAASVAMLVPYYLLRSVVPPMSGFNGY